MTTYFGPFKEALGGNVFQSDDDMYEALQEWLRIQPQEFSS
jgi:hypothetical protein